MLQLLRQPRWIALIVAVPIGVILCLMLSDWQWNRYEGRKDANAVIAHNRDLPIEPVEAVLPVGTGVDDSTLWRMVSATGRYDESGQLLVRRKPLDNVLGFWVATPLVTTDGTVLVVNRGWVAAGSDARATPAVPPPPSGTVTVTGRLQGTQQAPTPRPADMPAGQISALDTGQIGAVAGDQVYSGYVNLVTSDPAQAPGLTLIPLPPIEEGPHLSYSMQWIAFAILFIVGLVLLIRREVITRREEAAELAASTQVADTTTRPDESPRLPQDSHQ